MDPTTKLTLALARFQGRAGLTIPGGLGTVFMRIVNDLDEQIAAMSMAREVIIGIARNGAHPGTSKRKRPTPHPSTNGGDTQREAALKILRRAKHPLGTVDLMDAMLRSGVTTQSKKFRSVIHPMLHRMEAVGEVKGHRRKGKRFVRWSAR